MYLIKVISAVFVATLVSVRLAVPGFAEEKSPAYLYEDNQLLRLGNNESTPAVESTEA